MDEGWMKDGWNGGGARGVAEGGNTRWMTRGSFKSNPPRTLKPNGSLIPSLSNVISMATERKYDSITDK